MIAKKIEIIVPIHNKFPTNPSQAKCIKAALKSEMNNLSPLVVSKPNIPLLGVLRMVPCNCQGGILDRL